MLRNLIDLNREKEQQLRSEGGEISLAIYKVMKEAKVDEKELGRLATAKAINKGQIRDNESERQKLYDESSRLFSSIEELEDKLYESSHRLLKKADHCPIS
eukprot:46629-Eustigmatos_ZCMA.PRE.1